MANVSQLQPSLTPQVQTASSEAREKDADFLALRLLNKRARLRLSPEPLDLASFPGKVSLFATVNSKGWFAAIIRDATGASAFILSPLADLRSGLATTSADDDQPFRPQRRVPINGPLPHSLTFAYNDSRMLLGLVDGSIHVYASDQLFSDGDGPIQPIHVFSTPSSAPLLSIQPNPGDIPELVAVLRDCTQCPGSLAVELLDVQSLISSGGWMAGKSPGTTPTAISWSPKGKQLALGLQSGDIVTFSPTATATPKSSIPHPPSASNMSLISVHWLSTSSFHTIYAPPGPLRPDLEQMHFHVSLDAKINSVQDIRFNNPYLPFPGLRPPGEFLLCLRGWSPSKVLLFIGDSTSSDIGLIGSVIDDSGESWQNLSLEETSTPSLPLDKDQNDTVILGMDVDLTSTESYHHSTASGEALDLPAHPIMYVYASDGTVLGWHVLNVTGAPYPGIVLALNVSSALDVPSLPSGMVRELSSDMQTTPTISPITSAPTETPTIAPTSGVFGQPTGSVQSPAFGGSSTAFGQPAFGQTAFGKTPSFGQTTAPAFGSTSTPTIFGQPSTTPFGSAAPSVGFEAFGSTGPAKFGQSAFGFGGPSQTTPAQPPSPLVPEESMVADDAPSFGGIGLGTTNDQAADSKPSIFGKVDAPTSLDQQSADSGLIKPGTGFGAFSGFDQKSPFARSSAFSGTQQSISAFSSNTFQPKPDGAPSTSFGAPSSFGTGQPAFGQSSFGQSSFGQPQPGTSAFGKVSFSAVSTTAPPATSSFSTTANSGGAFSAFASGTQSAFGVAASKNTSAKPVWAANDSSKPPEPKGMFGKPPESPESKTPTVTPLKATGTPSTTSPFAAPSTSPFAVRDPATKDDVDSTPPSPALAQRKEASSPFTSSTPGPTTGAFSNLQTTPSAFIKPASGSFGELPKDSPFFSSKLPASVFSLAPTTVTPASTLPKSSSAQPAFGAPSMPGATFKSAFVQVATTPTQPPPVSGGGAFSAFTTGGGFAAFSSGGSKSFSDLLRSNGEAKPSAPTPPDTTPKKSEQAPPPSISTTPAQEPPKLPFKPSVVPTAEKEELAPVRVKTGEVATEVTEKETILVPEPSLESVPSSTSSSFVKVSEEEGEIVDEEARGDDADSFLSEEPSESDVSEEEIESSEVSEEEEAEEQVQRETEREVQKATEEQVQKEMEERVQKEAEEQVQKETEEQSQKGIEPADIPLSITPPSIRSPSTTPKAEHPKITVSVSPPPQTPSPAGIARVSPVREQSTTPPSSPVKDNSSLPSQAPAPPPRASPPPTLPFGLAPRSNNRPIRSSPLASTPLVLEGEGEKSPPVSKSAPPPLFPQPAAPKALFGQWTPPPAQLSEAEAARPQTPPLLSVIPTTGEKPAPSVFASGAMRPPVPTSIFAPAEKATLTTTAPAMAPGPVFSLPSSFAPITPSGATPRTWGTPSKPVEATPFAPKVPPSLFGSPQPTGLFSVKTGSTVSIPSSPFVAPLSIPSMTTSPGPALPLPKPPTPEQGMQAECGHLVMTITKELEQLKGLATKASAKVVELKMTSGVAHEKADLSDPHKWRLGDVEEYGSVLVDVQEDIKELKLQRVSLRTMLKELDSNVLKVTTRKEEIARFDKARTDPEFARMLKIRTLAPEYSETQSQLRKNIRMINDRVQKLEDHLQASKRRINEHRTGRPSIKPPSLDTVNRTFRNIDIAIDQQKQEIVLLRQRMAKLEVSGGAGARGQFSLSSSKRPLNVTPNVAITTAATLNAERSAQRFKKVLLASRTQPLLNTSATASPIPASLQTPQKAAVVKQETKTPESTFSLPSTLMMSFPSSLPSWTPPPSLAFVSPPASVTPEISPSRSRGAAKHHQKPIVLKKNANASSSAAGDSSPSPSPFAFPPSTAPPSLFEWKPVEPITPVSSLPFALRPPGSS